MITRSDSSEEDGSAGACLTNRAGGPLQALTASTGMTPASSLDVTHDRHHGGVELVFGLVGVAGLLVTLGAWWWSVRVRRNDRRLSAVDKTQSAAEAELVQRQLARARIEDDQRQRQQTAAEEAAREQAAAAKRARVRAFVDYRPSAEAGWVLTAGVENDGPCDARQLTYDVEPAVDVWPRCTAGPYSVPVVPVGGRYVNDLQLFWPEQVAVTVEWTDGLGAHRQRFQVTLPERPADPPAFRHIGTR